MRAAVGRPTGGPFQPTERDAVDAALRGLPSHGWTQGMFGRRDRCLLVLSQLSEPMVHSAAGNRIVAAPTATVISAAVSGRGVEDTGMKTFRPYQPDQLLLLPPSIQNCKCV